MYTIVKLIPKSARFNLRIAGTSIKSTNHLIADMYSLRQDHHFMLLKPVDLKLSLNA